MKSIRIRTDIIGSVLLFLALILCAVLADFILHKGGMARVGRYLGYAGSGLILLSFVYSLRKYRFIRKGSFKTHLAVHEYLTWIGALMVLIHGGIHFNALLPWLAMVSMLVAVASGLTGRFLLKHSRNLLEASKNQMANKGLTSQEIERELFWDSLVVDAMKHWRAVHRPITAIFGFLALMHIFSIILFWNW